MSLCRYDTTQECNKTYTRGCLDCILDKIRAEISDIACYVNGEMMIEVVNLERVLEIIDKYRKETE